jgi:hypothetical protein
MRFPALFLALAALALGTTAQAQQPAPIPADQFAKLSKMIKPQPGESLFMQIPWVLSLWEGRQKAAAEGKPMLVWAGGWGVPIGSC